MQHVTFLQESSLVYLEEIAACNEDGELLMFDSMGEASDYQNTYSIDGQVIELPIY